MSAAGLPPSSFAGKIAVISGAANFGIGWGIATHCAGLGMHVAIMDLQPTATNNAVAELRKVCPEVAAMGVVCDVTSADSMRASVGAVQREWPGVPIGAVFCNAGVLFPGTIARSSLEDWAATLQVNVFGVVNMIKAYLPIMQEQKETSVIVNTASVGGVIRGDIGAASYQASKHAVVALSESLSGELCTRAPQIQVHVLCPCIVASQLGATSAVNKKIKAGELRESAQVKAADGGGALALAMTPAAHARQIFDYIQRGEFYMITENERPYVDHDLPFGATELVEERMRGILARKLDNTDNLAKRSAILKGPMFRALARRAAAARSKM